MGKVREREIPNESEPVTEEVESEPTTTESDPQELTFLDRREGDVMSAQLVEFESRELRRELAQRDADRGAAAHRVGRRLRTLYTGFAERREGVPTFVGFAQSRFGIGRTTCHDLVRLDVATSEETARQYGFGRSILGLRLLELTGLQSFEALEKQPLDVGLDEPIYFPAPVRHLQQAINVLRQKSRPSLSRSQSAKLNRLSESLAERRSTQPALDGVRLGFVADEKGEAVLELHGRLGRDARAALAKVLAGVVRDERPR